MVNELAGGDYLQFTTEFWLPHQASTRYSPQQNDKKELGVTVIRDSSFPLLDMRMEWDNENKGMKFSVYRKPKQALKYVERNSTHRPTMFKSIANGVFTRLARRTSKNVANGHDRIDDIYLDHAKALFTADLAPPTDSPTFEDLWHHNNERKKEPIKSKW
eukprot:4845075-Ditylum_brightwellii.AAC.1